MDSQLYYIDVLTYHHLQMAIMLVCCLQRLSDSLTSSLFHCFTRVGTYRSDSLQHRTKRRRKKRKRDKSKSKADLIVGIQAGWAGTWRSRTITDWAFRSGEKHNCYLCGGNSPAGRNQKTGEGTLFFLATCKAIALAGLMLTEMFHLGLKTHVLELLIHSFHHTLFFRVKKDMLGYFWILICQFISDTFQATVAVYHSILEVLVLERVYETTRIRLMTNSTPRDGGSTLWNAYSG